MAVTVKHFHPITGTDAEPLWDAGIAEVIAAGASVHDTPPPIDPRWHAWVAYDDGAPVAVQVSYPNPATRESHGLITYVVPGARGRRLYSTIQETMDADLLAMGMEATVFSTPFPQADSKSVAAAVLARGGVQTGARIADRRGGSMEVKAYRRALR